MERTAKMAPNNAEVFYDLAVIRLAAGLKDKALDALKKALLLNPKLKIQAKNDKDMNTLKKDPTFMNLIKE